MTATPTTPAFDLPGGRITIPRDRFNRPMVIPQDGGKAQAYTRCTTFVDVLEDKYNLQRWQLRQAMLGLSQRPDLLLSVSAHYDDKRALDRIVDQACEAAKSSAPATTGTAVHALCERVDRGEALGVVPRDALIDVDAYRRATTEFSHHCIEQFTVQDDRKVGGTPDRVSAFRGGHYIVDIKTGSSIEWGALKIAMQLAMYSRSVPYDPATGQRIPYPLPVDQDWGIVIHLPAGQANATLHWIDIRRGWQAIDTAADVRTWRSEKNWYMPIDTPPPPSAALTIEEQISKSSTVDELRQVWTRAVAAQDWTPAHLERALARKQELEKAS